MNANKEDGTIAMKAYCFKCRREIEIKHAQGVNMKNGRPAVEGVCSCCGGRVFKVGKK